MISHRKDSGVAEMDTGWSLSEEKGREEQTQLWLQTVAAMTAVFW